MGRVPRANSAKEKENSDQNMRSQTARKARETTSAISQDRISIRISRTCSTAED